MDRTSLASSHQKTRSHSAAISANSVNPGLRTRASVATKDGGKGLLALFRKKVFQVLKFAQVARELCEVHILQVDRLGPAYQDQVNDINQQATSNLRIYREGLAFNRDDYQANRHMRLSQDARRILTQHPQVRNDEDVHYASVALRDLKAFAELPYRMQLLLARHGMLESYQEKRVVLRSGDPAQAFYFIIYGLCIVAVITRGGDKATTAVVLKRGESFGELAIVNRTKRQSTVIAKTEVDLLSISTETYEQIYMVGGRRSINDPDHNRFMENLDFLRGWPQEVLGENPSQFVFSYYKNGEVIMKNSNYSKWIIIVKNGSVNVMKRVPQLKSRIRWRENEIEQVATLPQSTPSNLLDIKVPKMYNRLGRFALPQVTDGQRYYVRETRTAEYEDELRACIRSFNKKLSDVMVEETLNELMIDFSIAQSDMVGLKKRLVKMEEQLHFERFVAQTRREPVLSRARLNLTLLKQQLASDNLRWRLKKNIPTREEQLAAVQKTSETSKKLRTVTTKRRTIADDLDADFSFEEQRYPEEMFVKIGTLTKGQVFGLQYILFKNQPSFILTSNGADIMLLSKELFLKHCSKGHYERLEKKIQHYPSDDELLKNLQERIDWVDYKDRLLGGIVSRIEAE